MLEILTPAALYGRESYQSYKDGPVIRRQLLAFDSASLKPKHDGSNSDDRECNSQPPYCWLLTLNHGNTIRKGSNMVLEKGAARSLPAWTSTGI